MSINNPYNLRQFRNKVQVSEQLNDYCPLETTAKSGKIRVSRHIDILLKTNKKMSINSTKRNADLKLIKYK